MRSACVALVCSLSLVSACALKPVSAPHHAGTVATTRDGLLRYRVLPDTDRVEITDLETGAVLARVEVGKSPEKILLGRDDTAYVVNRASRSLSVIRRAEYREAARLTVGVEPVGLALSPDGARLVVINGGSLDSPERGTVVAIDTAGLQILWELPLASSPRALELIGASHARIYTEGNAQLVIDLATRAVLSAGGPTFSAASM
jgi:DNA-binding beta-propeller fold protein YncE